MLTTYTYNFITFINIANALKIKAWRVGNSDYKTDQTNTFEKYDLILYLDFQLCWPMLNTPVELTKRYPVNEELCAVSHMQMYLWRCIFSLIFICYELIGGNCWRGNCIKYSPDLLNGYYYFSSVSAASQKIIFNENCWKFLGHVCDDFN